MTTALERELALSVMLTAPGDDESVPVSFPRPLSVEDAEMISSIIKRYEGIDQPLVSFMTETEVVLRVPKIRRVFNREANESLSNQTPEVLRLPTTEHD